MKQYKYKKRLNSDQSDQVYCKNITAEQKVTAHLKKKKKKTKLTQRIQLHHQGHKLEKQNSS